MPGGGMVNIISDFYQDLPAGMGGSYHFKAHCRINYAVGINSTSEFRISFNPGGSEILVYNEELHSQLDPPYDHEFDIDAVVALPGGPTRLNFGVYADTFFDIRSFFYVYLDNVSLKKVG